jgi:hypothetical protein
MRRLRDAGIVTMLLLGLTGCAGVQQRLGWTEPPYVGDDGPDERPLSRLAFWRRQRAEETTPAASAPMAADPGRSPIIAGNAKSPDDGDGERPGLLRRLPLVSRLWKGGDRGESDDIDVPASRYKPGAANATATAFAPPRSTAATTAFASPRPSAASTAPPAATPAPAPAPAPSTAAVQPDRSEDEPLRQLSVDLAASKPQIDSAAVPARNAGSPPGPEAPPPVDPVAESAPPTPDAPDPEPQQTSTPAPTAVPSRSEAAPPPTAVPGAQPAVGPDLAPASPSQGPSPTLGPQAASGSSGAPTVVSSSGPVWVADGPTTFSGSGQSLVMASAQAGYVSGGCETSCGPTCKVHKLCPFKKHKQQVLASAQCGVSPCADTCKVKKPCFLKTWLHHKAGCKAKGCGGCKPCSYCGEPAAMVSAQGPIVSPQW